MVQVFAYFDHDEDGKVLAAAPSPPTARTHTKHLLQPTCSCLQVDYSELCHELLGLDRPMHVRHKVSHGKEPKLTPGGQRLVKRLKEKLERSAAHPRKLYQALAAHPTATGTARRGGNHCMYPCDCMVLLPQPRVLRLLWPIAARACLALCTQ